MQCVSSLDAKSKKLTIQVHKFPQHSKVGEHILRTGKVELTLKKIKSWDKGI